MNEGWKDTWVDTAVSEARRIWNDHYKTTIKLPAPESAGGKDTNIDPFYNLDCPVLSTTIDPFDEFIMGTQNDDDAVEYWTKRLAVPHSPIITPQNALARMALDFLSAPATSTDVERLFSHSGIIVAKRRYNLTAESIRESTLLGNWLGIEGLVPEVALARYLDSRRARKVQTESEWSCTSGEEDEEKSEDEEQEQEQEQEDDVVMVSDDDSESESVIAEKAKDLTSGSDSESSIDEDETMDVDT